MRTTVAFVVVFGLVGAGPANPEKGLVPIENIFRDIARQAPKKLAPNPDHWLKFTCKQYIKEGIVPNEFKALNGQLWASYSKREYRQCAAIASQMEKLLPHSANEFTFGANSVEVATKSEKNPRSGRAYNEVLDREYLIWWRNYVAKFRALGNDYVGALRDYELVRKMKPIIPDLGNGNQCVAHASAAYGQALMHAILGHREQALKFIGEAPTIAPSWCGTCQAGEFTEAERQLAVIDAATLPGAKAEAALERLVRFGPKPKKPASSLENPSWNASDIFSVRVEATFMLGELYLREGKTGLAKQAFEAIQNFQFTDKAQMAISRVRLLSQKDPGVYEEKHSNKVLHI